jgi:phospholipase/lecithinase/hemolysin
VRLNNYAIGFNAALKPLLSELQTQLPGSVFVYTNAFDVVKAIIDDPIAHGNYRPAHSISSRDCNSRFWCLNSLPGFTDPVTTACCGVGKYNGIDGACRTIGNLCDDRTKSVFWDAFHPTESVNKICSDQFLSGGPDVVSPLNVQQLLAM